MAGMGRFAPIKQVTLGLAQTRHMGPLPPHLKLQLELIVCVT